MRAAVGGVVLHHQGREQRNQHPGRVGEEHLDPPFGGTAPIILATAQLKVQSKRSSWRQAL
jgi:hypothetical protein